MAERNTIVMIVVDQACVSTISEKIIVLFAILPLRNSASVVSKNIFVLFAILPLRRSASVVSENSIVLFAILRHSASVVSKKVIVLFAILPLRRSASVVMVSEKQIVSLAHLIYSVHITDHEISARPAGREQKTNYDYHIYLYLKLAALDC